LFVKSSETMNKTFIFGASCAKAKLAPKIQTKELNQRSMRNPPRRETEGVE
jgi:hypothetical protein